MPLDNFVHFYNDVIISTKIYVYVYKFLLLKYKGITTLGSEMSFNMTGATGQLIEIC